MATASKKQKQEKNLYSINETEFKNTLQKILSFPNKPLALQKNATNVALINRH
jgi:hypothetical protein